MSSTPLVRAQRLVLGYGGEPVCAPVTFTLAPGKALALVGANGSGKSTVLRAVLGLLEPAGGVVEVLGEAVDERKASVRAAVAGVLDDDAWFPALTVAEHLYLTAQGHGIRSPKALVEGLLAEFGLTEHARSLPVALSSGQRRRLLLAAAFARPRSLLVLDEPEQRLDTQMKMALAQRLNNEKAAGCSILMACHDAELVLAVADRAVLVGDTECKSLTPQAAADAIRQTP